MKATEVAQEFKPRRVTYEETTLLSTQSTYIQMPQLDPIVVEVIVIMVVALVLVLLLVVVVKYIIT